MTKTKLETLILRLLKEKAEIRIRDVAQAAGLLTADERYRKTIRRILKTLTKQGILEARGAAGARVYVALKSVTTEVPSVEGPSLFKEIPLSIEGKALLKYVSQSIQVRIPTGYNQTFLRSYEPNQTFYLTSTQRAELLKTGTVEAKIRPAGTYARNILNRLLVDLSWNSSRLEGNTYSLLETERLIELGESASGKNITEAQMILNHKEAIEYIIESAADEKISSHEVCSIHALLSENLLGDPGASGRIRQIAVGIGGTNYMPLENPHVLKECFQIFVEKLNSIKDPFEQSFFSLIQLSYLQAFEDVNKRTARLVSNIPLIKNNLRPLSFIDIDSEAYVKSILGVYEKNDVSLFRDLYLWAYSRSAQRYSAIQQALGEPNLFKLKYRSEIQDIIRTIILEEISGAKLVQKIQYLIKAKKLPKPDSEELFKLIEIEIVSLHDGNIARFKIRPSEFQKWKRQQ